MKRCYVQLDCDFMEDPRIIEAGVVAEALITRIWAYCFAKRNGGVLPRAEALRHVCHGIPNPEETVEALVRVGLLRLVPHPRFGEGVPTLSIAGWCDRYGSPDEQDEHRRRVSAARSAAGQRGGLASGASRRERAERSNSDSFASKQGSKTEAFASPERANGKRNEALNRDKDRYRDARGANAGVGGSGEATASGPHAEGDDYEPPADDDWVPPYEEPLAFSADDLALVDEPEGGFEGGDPETGRPALRVLTGSGGEADPSTDTALERPQTNSTALVATEAPKKRSKSAEANVAPEDVRKVWDAYVAAIRTPGGLWKPRPRSGDRMAFTAKYDLIIRKAIVGFGLDAVLHAVSAWRWDGWCAGVKNGEPHYGLDRLLAVNRPEGGRLWVVYLQGIETDGVGGSEVNAMLDRFMENNGFVDGVGFVGTASIGAGS